MCACDEAFGTKFLPHQLYEGTWLDSKEHEEVTIGFQSMICTECKGVKAIAAPKASRPGATSKVVRYYWREIYFETTKRFAEAHPELSDKDILFDKHSFADELKQIEKIVIKEIKATHLHSPKYEYREASQNQILSETNTEVILVNAEHVQTEQRKVGFRNNDKIVNSEDLATIYFENDGYRVIQTESRPFHVLFGVFMWIVIQDPRDEKNQMVQFGSRSDFDNKNSIEGMITTTLPEDFDANGYYVRRKSAIEKHINDLKDQFWLFDYWLSYSNDFRQYLWAHREKDIETARSILEVIDLEHLKTILRYMTTNYWRNFCGWPDLLISKNDEIIFVEVKSSNDKLSEEQKNWFLGNHNQMGFEAKVFKIGKERKQSH